MGFMAIKPMPQEKMYDRIVTDYDRNVKSEILDHKYIERFLFYLKKGSKLLDAGAGTGKIAFEMHALHGLRVIGIDISKEMVRFAAKKYPKVKFKEMDLRDLRFKTGEFDAIFANYSLIHILEDDILRTLEGFNRILKDGGYIYISLQSPKKKWQRDGYYPIPYKRSSYLFINLVKKSEIVDYLEKAHFQVLEVYKRAPDVKTEFPFNKLFVIAKKRR